MAAILLLTLAVLVAMIVVMAAGWAYQRARTNGGWTDVFWTFGTGFCLVLVALWPVAGGAITARQWLVAALVAIWSLRLGIYIARRVSHGAEDPRYARFRRDWGADFQRRMFWFLESQAVATALLALAVLIAARNPAPGLQLTDALGALVMLAGIGGEAIADAQMHAFRADPANKGRVCDAGLWGWSRHPNYFFEWLVWLAYPVIAVGGLPPYWWLAFVGPLLMYWLLTRVSGVPPLEEAMMASRGEAYAKYRERVSAFFPLPPSRSPRG